MLSNVYRLVAPGVFEPAQVELDPWSGVAQGEAGGEPLVLVRPTHLSICQADMRYYLGSRPAEVLARKLPMALIHEGVGRVVADPSGTLAPGQRVVMLPNNAHEVDPCIGENYLPSSRFCGSGYDGFMQEYVALRPERLIALPEGMDLNVAAFTELVSVAMHAIKRFEDISHERRDTLGVWGDGNLGYIVALLLRARFPQARIVVFGRNDYKLADFTFADETYLTTEVPADLHVDHAFECCGGDGSESAIEQIIGCIRPEGTIALLGVSENPPAVNTRMVLEKGLRVFGSSRSDRESFEEVVRLYQQRPEVVDYLQALVGNVVRVTSVSDMTRAFQTCAQRGAGKTIMQWDV